MRYRIALVLVLLCLLTVPARAAGAESVGYQGYLSGALGAAIDTDKNITFSIYNVETGGSPLWSDTTLVSLDQGLFSVTLGSPANPFPAGLFDTLVHLGLSVESDAEMTPRRPITSVAFSFKADDADTLQGRTAAELDQAAAVAALWLSTSCTPSAISATPTTRGYAARVGLETQCSRSKEP